MKQRQQEKYCGDESNEDRRCHRRVHLAMRQHGDNAFVVCGICVRMNQFVKRG
jgi:hypothetical protein